MQTKAYFASSVPAALEVARQELGDEVGAAVILAEVVHGDDVRMRAELSQQLRLAAYADPAGIVEPRGR